MSVRASSRGIVRKSINKQLNSLSCSLSPPPSKPSFFSKCHGYMAQLSRKYLVCFYCNKKSNVKYDGFISQWHCETCEATNYLDENGDFTDPPISTIDKAEPTPQYAFYRGNTSNLKDPNSTFCEKCLENQRMKVSCLSQFHVEVDPEHPQYKQSERRLFAFQRDLEKRYPQVCGDCAPKAQEIRDKADKAAKSDWLGRMLDKTRENRYKKSPTFSFEKLFCYIASKLWYAGIITQILANSASVIIALNCNWSENDYLMKYMPFLPIKVATPIIFNLSSRTCLSWSLWFSGLSIWWNPMFNQMKTGFTRHIRGFGDWYFHQCLLLILRGLFYSIIGTGIISKPSSSATIAANAFTICFTLYLAIESRRCLVVDMTPLWNSTPDRLRVETQTASSDNSGNSLSDILDEIAGTTSKANQQNPTPIMTGAREISPKGSYGRQQQSGRDYPGYSRDTNSRDVSDTFRSFPAKNYNTQGSRYSNGRTTNYSPPYGREGLYSRRPDIPTQLSATQLPLSQMTPQHFMEFLHKGELPGISNSDSETESMDWAPTRQQPQFKPMHRALNPELNPQYKPQPFGFTATFNEPSPFYGKLPPAPITPAQRLRNPPNQARLTAHSEEKKQNFFNKMTQRDSISSLATNSADPTRREIEIAPPKFFAPEAPGSELTNQLSDLLTSFSISDGESTSRTAKRRFQKRYLLQVIVLVGGILFWRWISQNRSG